MSNTITEQDESLTRAEETARVTKNIITTLAVQYENVRKRLTEVRKREREATRKNRKLQAQLNDARSLLNNPEQKHA
jgi:hypothetical protein